MIYWIDAGVLIQAARGTYRFKMIPQFWQFVHTQSVAGTIRMPRLAYEEITDGGYDDQLVAWCKSRKQIGLCRNETRQVQERYGLIAHYVRDKNPGRHQQVRDFLAGADGWLIAYALATPDSVVVTEESDRSYRSKIKVPTICRAFDLQCRNTSQMLEALDADLSGMAVV